MEAPKAPARTKRLHGGKDAAKDDGTSPLDENEEWAKVGVGQFTIPPMRVPIQPIRTTESLGCSTGSNPLSPLLYSYLMYHSESEPIM